MQNTVVLIVYLSLVSTYHIQLHTYKQFKKIHRPILYRITRDSDRFKINMSLHIHVIKYKNIFYCDIFKSGLMCVMKHTQPHCGGAVPPYSMYNIHRVYLIFYSVLRPFQDYFSSYENGPISRWEKTDEPREKPPGTPTSRTWLVSHMACAGLEPILDPAVRC